MWKNITILYMGGVYIIILLINLLTYKQVTEEIVCCSVGYMCMSCLCISDRTKLTLFLLQLTSIKIILCITFDN